jgi:hypothetical protein
MKLGPSDNDLIGTWKLSGGSIVADATSRRIDRLVKEHLVRLGNDPSGWDTLYRDPDDGRLWELTYPQSDSQGGGPPRLTYLPAEQAREKYGSGVVGGG